MGFEQQFRVWSRQPVLWQHLQSTWQQVLPYKGLELCSCRGHKVCWLELRIHRLHEPVRCRVPVRCAQLVLWRSLCWGRRCLLSERGRIRLRVWSRLTLRQERVSSRSLRCLNSSALPLPKVRGRTCDLLQDSSPWQQLANHMRLHRLLPSGGGVLECCFEA